MADHDQSHLCLFLLRGPALPAVMFHRFLQVYYTAADILPAIFIYDYFFIDVPLPREYIEINNTSPRQGLLTKPSCGEKERMMIVGYQT